MDSKPNIVLILADDLRFDAIAELGHPDVRTPNIDRLVRSGTSFTNAHIQGGTCAAICMPSRGMLHTGVNLFGLTDSGSSIPEHHVLLGEHLGRNGYDTYGIGKWHNGPAAFNRSFADGDEIMFGGMADHWNVPANSYDPTGRYDRVQPHIEDPFYSNEVKHRIVDRITPGKHSTDLFTDAAAAYLEERESDRPFFLYVSYMAPHDPRSMPKKYLDLYDPEKIALPPNFMGAHPFDIGVRDMRDEQLAPYPRTEEDTRRQLAEYYAMISHLDDRIGDLIQDLDGRGLLDDTIIVFGGDNGLAVGQHGLFGKQNMYDHSIRVPLIFTGPGIPTDRRNDSPVYLSDIFPTLCDLLELPVPETIEADSIAPAIISGNAAPRNHLYMAFEGSQRAVRRGSWKLAAYKHGGATTLQLFNLENDRWERNDRSEDPECAEIRDELWSLLQKCASESGEYDSLWEDIREIS